MDINIKFKDFQNEIVIELMNPSACYQITSYNDTLMYVYSAMLKLFHLYFQTITLPWKKHKIT